MNKYKYKPDSSLCEAIIMGIFCLFAFLITIVTCALLVFSGK